MNLLRLCTLSLFALTLTGCAQMRPAVGFTLIALSQGLSSYSARNAIPSTPDYRFVQCQGRVIMGTCHGFIVPANQ